MLKTVLFQTHWFLGITAGLVLMVVGFTGGMLSFEDDIIRWLSPGVVTVEPAPDGPLAPSELAARIASAEPEKTVSALTLSADPGDSARVTFAPPPGEGRRRGETRYVDPYTGALLGDPRGEDFFHTVTELHRWLLSGDVGKQIVGASTIALVFFALSGLYLRWPRRALSLRAWLQLDLRHRGRSLLWELHSIVGTWVLIPYLLMALTGLYWSYDWYRDGLFALAGVERPAFGGRPGGAPPAERPGEGGETPAPESGIGMDEAWAIFVRESRGFSSATLQLAEGPGQPFRIRYLDADPPHEQASNTLVLQGADGAVMSHERYAEKPLNERLMGSMLPLHSGSYFGVGGVIVLMVASLLMPLFALSGWLLYLGRRKHKAEARAAARALTATEPAATTPRIAGDPVLIFFASQTGNAERLAWQSAAMLRAAGRPAEVQPLGRMDPGGLAEVKCALFVASTFGDGEAPDGARPFMRAIAERPVSLTGLSYGLLALGNRNYEQFCSFGHALDSWLRRQGAEPLFDRVDVDRGDDGALRHWQHHLSLFGEPVAVPDWHPPAYRSWRLTQRRLMNAGSAGWPCHHLELVPADYEGLDWQAGDIAEVGPRHAPEAVAAFLAATGLDGDAEVESPVGKGRFADSLACCLLPETDEVAGATEAEVAAGLVRLPHREYSVASLPADRAVHLLVRQMHGPDGLPALGSGWLTLHAPLDGEIDMRLRSNPGFHPPEDDRPMILVGNGTGIAGLRAHIKARARAGRHRNWLVFGERNAATDAFYGEEIEAWRAAGLLDRVDLVFSRDQATKIYVQDRLRAHADDVRSWVAGGAAIYVCGSLKGMAPRVEAALTEILGRATVERLAATGCYRRDVY